MSSKISFLSSDYDNDNIVSLDNSTLSHFTRAFHSINDPARTPRNFFLFFLASKFFCKLLENVPTIDSSPFFPRRHFFTFLLPHQNRKKLKTLKHHPQTCSLIPLSQPLPSTFHYLRSNLKSKLKVFSCLIFYVGSIFVPCYELQKTAIRGQFASKIFTSDSDENLQAPILLAQLERLIIIS